MWVLGIEPKFSTRVAEPISFFIVEEHVKKGGKRIYIEFFINIEVIFQY